MQMTKNVTFLRRLKRQAIYWGIPMVCLNLIGVPLFGWSSVLAIVVPATLVAVLAGSLFEHLLATLQLKQNEMRQRNSWTQGTVPASMLVDEEKPRT
jgi:anaerobic C4-dicarboxylate transporter